MHGARACRALAMGFVALALAVLQDRHEAFALDWQNIVAAVLGWVLATGQLEKSGHEINNVTDFFGY